MIIEMKDVVKRYGDLVALNHFNLNVEEGEVLGLLGPNGSGKTTAINCLISLLKYNHGDIMIFGEQMKPTSNHIKEQIGVVMQEVAVFKELTVQENVEYFCGLYIRDQKLRKQYVQEAIEFVQLQEFKKFLPKKLSGGLLRRLNIACGIAHKPKLLIFDEPTVAVDPQSRNNILEGVKRLNASGATIIYTSHYMEEIEYLCDRIVIMDQGKTIAEGNTRSLKEMIQLGNKIAFTVENTIDTQLFAHLPYVLDVQASHNQLIFNCKKGQDYLLDLINELKRLNIIYSGVQTTEPTLNDVFLEITGKELRD